MPLAVPPELKKIIPFVRRAEELDKDKTSPESRLVAYYCRQYAVHIGIPLSSSSPGAKTCLGHLLGNLEQEKPSMDNFTRDEAAFLCRKFANAVFDKADIDDRNGNADKNTAKAFYAAASFLQILEQFSDDSDTSEEVAEDKRRILYAKWKATEILKAIKEGRDPTPGGYGESDEAELALNPTGGDDEETEKKVDAPTAVITVVDDDDESVEMMQPKKGFELFPPTAPTTAMRPPPPPLPPKQEDETPKESDVVDEGMEIELGPPPAYPSGSSSPNNIVHHSADRPKITFDLPPPVEARTLPPPVKSPAKETIKPTISNMFGFVKKTSGGKASKAQITDAAELTRFALAALEDKDAELAAERLQQALQALGR